MTGDLIQDDTREAYERFRDFLVPLGRPVHCVPGNHDVRYLMQEVLCDDPFRYCAAAEIGNWLVIGIDSCLAGEAGGRVSEAELARLEQELAGTAAPHALVCLHHPPLPVGTKWLDQVGLANGSEFLHVAARSGKVRGALFGHVHQAFDRDFDGMRIVGTPSTCRQFLPGSDDFALDDKPPAYRHIVLGADGTIDTELIWLGND